MKKAGILLSPFILLLILRLPSYANDSSVHISSEGNASATVKVNNTFNSTNNSTNETTSHTSVRIESNGEVKEYDSDSLDDVEMESSDGNSKVSIKNNGDFEATSSPEPTEKKDIKPTSDVKKEIEEAQKKEETLFEKIKDAITDFLKSIF